MNYWWVNHSQTSRVEINEGYIWSPKRRKDGRRNQSYDNLTLTNVGDVIFSYADGVIKAVGIIIKSVVESPTPISFGNIGSQWSNDGWLVSIKWKLVTRPLSPKQYISIIGPLLPTKYSPIQPNGNGNQSVYLASIGNSLGKLLTDLIDVDDIGANSVIEDLRHTIWEDQIAKDIQNSGERTTMKEQLIEARVGQGFFRNEVEKIETKCRVTGLSIKSFLIASHIKPWRNSTNVERLDGNNGFLLSPHVDKLFDGGYISFNDTGKILVANLKLIPVLKIWNIDANLNVGSFKSEQKYYLSFHRDEVHKKKIENLKIMEDNSNQQA